MLEQRIRGNRKNRHSIVQNLWRTKHPCGKHYGKARKNQPPMLTGSTSNRAFMNLNDASIRSSALRGGLSGSSGSPASLASFFVSSFVAIASRSKCYASR